MKRFFCLFSLCLLVAFSSYAQTTNVFTGTGSGNLSGAVGWTGTPAADGSDGLGGGGVPAGVIASFSVEGVTKIIPFMKGCLWMVAGVFGCLLGFALLRFSFKKVTTPLKKGATGKGSRKKT